MSVILENKTVWLSDVDSCYVLWCSSSSVNAHSWGRCYSYQLPLSILPQLNLMEHQMRQNSDRAYSYRSLSWRHQTAKRYLAINRNLCYLAINVRAMTNCVEVLSLHRTLCALKNVFTFSEKLFRKCSQKCFSERSQKRFHERFL